MTGYYAGLDVSDRTTCLCVIDGAGATVQEETVATDPKAIGEALKPYKRVLKVVGQESGSKGPWLHKELARKRFPVVCMDARAVAGSLAAQRNKTDKNDARALANVLRTGWYTTSYVKTDEALRTRLLLTHRRMLNRSAARIEICLRMSLKVFGASLGKKGDAISITWAQRKPDPMLARLAQMMIRSRAALLHEVHSLDRLVESGAAKDPVCRRLMTMPGVGPLTALMFRAAIDDPSRFEQSRSVGAHFGLTPRRRQSGQMNVSGRISRMGDGEIRSALYTAASVVLNVSKRESTMRTWALRLKERKTHKLAAVALARKMAVVMHRMWVTGRDFDAR